MSQVSIFGKSWIDLVFEGRNKAYGAYQLRQENAKTSLLALFYAVFFFSSGAGIIAFISLSGPNVIAAPSPEVPDIIVTRYDAHPEIKPIAPQPKAATKASKPVEDVATKTLINPTVVKGNFEDVSKDPQLSDTAPSTDASPGGVPGGKGESPTVSPGTSETPVVDDGPMIPTLLDKQPQFPGGMDKFYREVGKRFKTPDIESDSGVEQNIRIFVSFVIEKDGSLTEIKVRNKPGHELDQEARRVLMSLRNKWEPGIYKGQPVRTLLALPITVRLNRE